MKLAGWGRYPVHETCLHAPRTEAALLELIQQGGLIARGNGRSYGDSAVSRRNTVHMRHFNRMVAFDPTSGQLTAEAGVLLGDVITAFLPRGWFPWVTPGTKFVTLGGMVAADVHGKNHHCYGSFGHCVDWIDVIGADGRTLRCSRQQNTELFDWTIGGMGLTGVILRVAFRLRRVETAWVRQFTIPAANLDAAMAVFEREQNTTYSVAWIDCLRSGGGLGRSLVMLGEHARLEELSGDQRQRPFGARIRRKLTVPINAPSGLLNSVTVRTFNGLYYWNGTRKAGTRLVDWDSYFYPLDAIPGWNRIYGRKGFAQFQCVLPLESSRAGLGALLELTSRAAAGSFLAVLKRFGAQQSRFSFPMEGYTLALDFPVNRDTLALMTALDGITIEHGGRIYLAKDSRMTAEMLRSSDPRTEHFIRMRDGAGLRASFQSQQSQRLAL
jgi:FAD/FMN-containing dehydrogenase